MKKIAELRKFFEEEGVANLSPEDDETFFSHDKCDCCLTSKYGDRRKATGFNPRTREIKHYTVCLACLYYAEYGEILEDISEEGE